MGSNIRVFSIGGKSFMESSSSRVEFGLSVSDNVFIESISLTSKGRCGVDLFSSEITLGVATDISTLDGRREVRLVFRRRIFAFLLTSLSGSHNPVFLLMRVLFGHRLLIFCII